ncbi:MAG TPA: hypothetical protein VE046_10460 [Steroidobacteraceae bacterium]|nr:hypothetical protein [Steroidobacteraceae bacterium]
MKNPAACALLASLILVPVTIFAAVKGWPQIGPFSPGMTFSEARAAAPSLTWKDGQVAPFTKTVRSIVADNAVTLGGLAQAVEMQPGYLENYRETFQYTHAVADAAECERLTLPVVADVERIVGSLAATPKYDTQPISDTTYHEFKQVGTSSTISFETNEDAARKPRTMDPIWRLGVAQHSAKETTVQVGSMYARDDKNARVCRITTIVEYAPVAIPTVRMEFDPSMVLEQASIGLKHISLEGVTLPSDTLELPTDCDVARQTGQLSCSLDAKQGSSEILAAAIVRIRTLRLNPAKLDPDNLTFLRITVPVVLAKSDHHAIDFLKAPRAKLADVSWTSRPSAAELESVYPSKLLAEGKTAHLDLACQIQVDGSLICADGNMKPPADPKALEDYKAFVRAGVAIMSLYVSGPKLKSGAAAAGTVIATPVSFKPE